MVVVHAGSAGVEPNEEGAKRHVHSSVVLELDNFAFVVCWPDAYCIVGHRGVNPASNFLLPHVDQLLINEHHAMQQVGEVLAQTLAHRAPNSLVMGCEFKPDPKDFKLEVWVQPLNPLNQGAYCHTRLPEHLLSCWALGFNLAPVPVGVAPVGFAPTDDTLVSFLCHLISELLIRTRVVRVAVKGTIRVHAPTPCEDEVAAVCRQLQACHLAEDSEQPHGDGGTATCQSQGKDGVVGNSVWEGHVICGGGVAGWQPTNHWWWRRLAQRMHSGVTGVGALLPLGVTQWRIVVGPQDPQCCRLGTWPWTQGLGE